MATNEEMRRQSGISMEQSRRAGGAAMIAERRGSDIATDLQLLSQAPTQRRSLPPVAPVGGVPAARGRATYTPKTSAGGIASPLTEADASTREYWPDGLTSSDGLFVLPAIKVLKLTDANGADVEIQLADPEGTA